MAKKDKKETEENLEEPSEEELKAIEEETLEDEDAEEELADPPTPAELSDLQELLTATQLEAAENMDGWQRTQAEMSNYRKRVEREQSRFFEDTSARVIKKFLDILDDLDRALANRPEEKEGAEWANGMELIYRKLHTILENEGVKLMETDGQIFDPNLHEAISQEESPEIIITPSGEMTPFQLMMGIDILQSRYRIIGHRDSTVEIIDLTK